MSDDNTQAIIDTAYEAARPNPISDDAPLYTVVVPAGASMQTIDVEASLAWTKPTPLRKKGQVSLTTPASLSQYLNAHKIEGTEVYADWRARKAVAVINDHAEQGAGWGDHRATLTMQATPEWAAWTALNGKWLSQEEFAEHIIDTAADVVSPDAADLLEMAESFNATKSVSFKSGNRLRDGQRQLTYVETIDAQAGKAGNVVIPESILLKLAPFDGAEPVEMGARIRYRINGGDLRIGYVLDRPDLVLRAAFAAVVAGVETDTGITALWGTPRDSGRT